MNPSITEVTTGATDALLALEALLCMVMLAGLLRADRFKVRLWLWIFGLALVASVLGAVAHGFDLSEGLRDLLWQPLYLSLGLMLGLIAVAAVYDRWGAKPARRALPLAVVTGVAFYGVTVILEGTFLLFVAYEAVAMLFALSVYARLAGRGEPGAGLMTLAVAVTLVAAIVQQTDWTVRLVWPFDHNGIFHLIQMPALLLFALGVRRGVLSRPEEGAVA